MNARPTRFNDLGYVQIDPSTWRIVDLDNPTPGQTATIGPYYQTKTELLADLERFSSEYRGDDQTPAYIVNIYCSGHHIATVEKLDTIDDLTLLRHFLASNGILEFDPYDYEISCAPVIKWHSLANMFTPIDITARNMRS